ncbi:MAG: hypothetical protein ACI4J0_11880 [Huintestinicola sp.]|uniref:hypothetical protein n=1 Tax=Huintestinicola sp. TaxID=2981661 RepID=UPI003EFD7972
MNTAEETLQTVKRQLNSFWDVSDIDDAQFLEDIRAAIKSTTDSYDRSNRIYYLKTGFDVMNTTVYAVFLYYLAHRTGVRGGNPIS